MAMNSQYVKNLYSGGLNGDTKIHDLTTEVDLGMALLLAEWQVTDAGISAGETFDGLGSLIKLYDANRTYFEAQTDELATLCKRNQIGHDTGITNDPVPVSNTKTWSYFGMTGLWELTKAENPALEISLRDVTEEFAGATAASVKVHMGLIRSLPGVVGLPQRAWRRFKTDSESVHAIRIPREKGRRLVGFVLEEADGSGGQISDYRIPGGLDVRSFPYFGHAQYSFLHNVAASQSPTSYMHTEVDVPLDSPAVLDVDCSADTTLKGWFLTAKA